MNSLAKQKDGEIHQSRIKCKVQTKINTQETNDNKEVYLLGFFNHSREDHLASILSAA